MEKNMLNAAITAVVALIEQLLPLIGGSNTALINSIIDVLAKWVPLITDEVQSIVPAIKNIIAALSANPATTAQQLDDLQKLDAQVDAAFDQAVADDPDNQP